MAAKAPFLSPLTGSAGLWQPAKPGFLSLAQNSLGDAGSPADGTDTQILNLFNAFNAADNLLDAISAAGTALDAADTVTNAIKMGDIGPAIDAATAASSGQILKIGQALGLLATATSWTAGVGPAPAPPTGSLSGICAPACPAGSEPSPAPPPPAPPGPVPLPPVTSPPAAGPCPPGFLSSNTGNCVPTSTGGGGETPPFLPPILPSGGGEGSGVLIGGGVLAAAGVLVTVAGAFLLFNWIFGSNFQASEERYAAWVLDWLKLNPAAAALYLGTVNYNNLQKSLAPILANVAERSGAEQILANQLAQLDAQIAQLRNTGVPPPKI
jgi:hypothetical protein